MPFEGELPSEHEEQHDAERPHIALLPVSPIFLIVHFRGHVLGCALFFDGDIIVMAKFDGCAKVRQLQLSQVDIAHQQDILWLQISVSSIMVKLARQDIKAN